MPETYLPVLQPKYRFTISFQNDKSPISALIPSLLKEEDERPSTLLTACFKFKFKYEIESEVYKQLVDPIETNLTELNENDSNNKGDFPEELLRDDEALTKNKEPGKF
ncbi:hypothetical protein BpHYR1_035972 [Brachionus plicatilis]|uniref:Uncharacterized protein n=1 Tax=Brachionus plicatilis TaxID=10195 RepID=A0A3M7QTH5_BRAPC|nr:hypothetical protein BpHYR1_035972 [Brachionus plicatilis]